MLNIFANNDNKELKAAGRQIKFTEDLARQSDALAREVLNVLNSEDKPFSVDDDMVAQAFENNDTMDDLIMIVVTDLDAHDFTFLKEATDEEFDRMLKSQQSKRSRAKRGQMTIESYLKVMSAAIAEIYIRKFSGKAKNASVGASYANYELTDELREELTNDQEKLKKAIRNVQSKKSIMKSKAGFDETSEQWQALLNHEAELKSLRTSTTTVVVKVPEEVEKAKELLENVEDIDKLKAADAKEVLAKLKEVLCTK